MLNIDIETSECGFHVRTRTSHGLVSQELMDNLLVTWVVHVHRLYTHMKHAVQCSNNINKFRIQ